MPGLSTPGILNENCSRTEQVEVVAVILAAGAARRFGRPKQLERWPVSTGPTLVERAAELASRSGVSRVLVVTGNQSEEVSRLVNGLGASHIPIQTIFNPRWKEGQGFSVAAGVKALSTETGAAIFFLADQPRLQLPTVQTLLQAFHEQFNNSQNEAEKAIIFPTYRGRRGNPVLFGKNHFQALARLEGDAGGRVVVKANPGLVKEIEVEDPAILEDVDTPEDLAKLG